MLLFLPTYLAGRAPLALVLYVLGGRHCHCLIREEGETVLYHQPDQPLGVEYELVPGCVPVPYVGVQALYLRGDRKDP